VTASVPTPKTLVAVTHRTKHRYAATSSTPLTNVHEPHRGNTWPWSLSRRDSRRPFVLAVLSPICTGGKSLVHQFVRPAPGLQVYWEGGISRLLEANMAAASRETLVRERPVGRSFCRRPYKWSLLKVDPTGVPLTRCTWQDDVSFARARHTEWPSPSKSKGGYPRREG
jgi:hypothetical protein